MAVDLSDQDYSLHLLPSKFLDQDYDAALRSVNKPINHSANSWSCFDSSDSGSVLCSPVESELGSTETESDPDDYMAELTRQMAHYMLQDDDKQEKSWASVVSPQSTLRSPFGFKFESPKAPSREPSPPLPNMIEEFDQMKINNKDMPCYNFSEIPSTVRYYNTEFHSKQALIDDQIRATQYYKLNLKKEQAMKQHERKKQQKQYQNKHRASDGFNNSQKANIRPPSSTSTTNSDMQQQPRSGKRAVFLKESGSRTGSSGTGVFLPQGVGCSSETRKKQGCSTVLIPARVVQALKQHFDKVGIPSRFGENFPVQNDGLMGGKNSLYSQQQSQSWAVPASNHQEMNLPQEWTY